MEIVNEIIKENPEFKIILKDVNKLNSNYNNFVELLENELQNLFPAALGATTFFRHKKYLVEVIKIYEKRTGKDLQYLLNKVNKITYKANISHQIKNANVFFADIDELLDVIESLFIQHGLNKSDSYEIQSIAVMSWYDIPLTEASDIKVSDIDCENCILKVGGKLVFLTRKSIEALKGFTELSYFTQVDSVRKTLLCKSDYLFRSARKKKRDNKDLSAVAMSMTKIISKYYKPVNLLHIKRNAIYHNIYETELNGVPYEEAICNMVSSCSTRSLMLREYIQWKMYYQKKRG